MLFVLNLSFLLSYSNDYQNKNITHVKYSFKTGFRFFYKIEQRNVK